VDSYAEYQPPVPARGLLACLWSRRVAGEGPGERRIVPDGCVDVIWFRDTGELLVAGPDTRAHLTHLAGGDLVGARFRPGRSPAVLGVPAHALRDERVDLASVWHPARTRRLADSLAAAASPRTVLADAVLDEVREAPDPSVPAMLALAREGTRVSTMADEIGLTERQLHRRCLTAFGYGAKVLQRVLRFDRAMDLARDGTELADVAYLAGYADQAHLSREVRALAGVSPTELLRSA